MTISLNLIPQSYRTKFRKHELYRLWRRIFYIVIVYVLFTGVVLLVTRFVMEAQFRRILSETSLVTAGNKRIEQQVTAMNSEVVTAQKLEADHQPWAAYLLAFSSYVPDDVRIVRADFRLREPSAIEGTAATRDALLELKHRLANAPEISNLDLPLSSLLSPTNVNFTIRFQLDLRPLNP